MKLPDDFATTIINLLKEHCPDYSSNFHCQIANWAAKKCQLSSEMPTDQEIIQEIKNPKDSIKYTPTPLSLAAPVFSRTNRPTNWEEFRARAH